MGASGGRLYFTSVTLLCRFGVNLVDTMWDIHVYTYIRKYILEKLGSGWEIEMDNGKENLHAANDSRIGEV